MTLVHLTSLHICINSSTIVPYIAPCIAPYIQLYKMSSVPYDPDTHRFSTYLHQFQYKLWLHKYNMSSVPSDPCTHCFSTYLKKMLVQLYKSVRHERRTVWPWYTPCTTPLPTSIHHCCNCNQYDNNEVYAVHTKLGHLLVALYTPYPSPSYKHVP